MPVRHATIPAEGTEGGVGFDEWGEAHVVDDATFTIAKTAGLQAALDGKASTSHSHVIGDVAGLQTALDGKQTAGSYEASGAAAAAIAAHVGAADPHPDYLTQAEADALYQAAGGGGGSPGGTSGQVQFNDAGAFAGAANIGIGAAGNLLVTSLSSRPDAPPAGRLQVYSRLRAGQEYLDVQRPSGRDFPLQPHMGVNRVGTWSPSAGTVVIASGMPRTAVGTVSHPALAATNLSTSIRRWRVASATTANAVADERTAVTICHRGNATTRGGFSLITRISLAIVPVLSRCLFGLHSSTAALATTQDPQALVNVLGIGFNQAIDANWQILHNDGAGTCEKIDLGAGFAVSSLTNLYTVFIGARPNGSSVFIRVVEEVSGAVAEHELTTQIPTATTFLAGRQYMNNGGTAASCAYECSGVYLETDF